MAIQDETDDFDVVATNAAAFYQTPADVFADSQLTRDQKLRVLEEWEIDLKRTLESDSEGMAQSAEGAEKEEQKLADDAALLRQVSNWLRRARGEDAGENTDTKSYEDAKTTVAGRVWHRIFGTGSAKQRKAA